MTHSTHVEACAPGRVAALARGHPLVAYVALAYGISWTLWVPGLLVGGVVGTAAIVLGAFGPAVAAGLVMRLRGQPLGPWLRRIVRWRVPLRYWAYALLLPPLLLASANVTLWGLGEEVHPGRAGSALTAYAGTFLFVAVLGGGQEEPGWRGYALGELQARHSPLRATLVLGVIWGVWHLPLYGLAFVGPMLFVVFYTWLYNRTGSLLLCILLHAGFTPSLEHLVLVDDGVVVDAVILGTLLAGAAAVILLTRGRLGVERAAEDGARAGAGAPRLPGVPAG